MSEESLSPIAKVKSGFKHGDTDPLVEGVLSLTRIETSPDPVAYILLFTKQRNIASTEVEKNRIQAKIDKMMLNVKESELTMFDETKSDKPTPLTKSMSKGSVQSTSTLA